MHFLPFRRLTLRAKHYFRYGCKKNSVNSCAILVGIQWPPSRRCFNIHLSLRQEDAAEERANGSERFLVSFPLSVWDDICIFFPHIPDCGTIKSDLITQNAAQPAGLFIYFISFIYLFFCSFVWGIRIEARAGSCETSFSVAWALCVHKIIKHITFCFYDCKQDKNRGNHSTGGEKHNFGYIWGGKSGIKNESGCTIAVARTN